MKTPQQRERMLDAAGRLFGSQRFHEVRMEDIAAEAVVGKGTLYRYFSDKDELYLALLARAAEQFRAHRQERLAGCRGPREKLEAMTEAVIEFFDQQPHVFDLIQRAELLRAESMPWQPVREETLRLVLDFLKEGRTSGEFEVGDQETTALLYLGGLRGVIRFGRRPRPFGLAKSIVDTILPRG